MGNHIIMVSSITYAIKGRDILRAKRFKAHIEKTPPSSDSHGCGYSIIVYEKIEQALEILKNNGIKIIGVKSR